MTSDAQRRANRQNARRSTGPKTVAGKAASSQNAVTHGLCAQGVTLPDEDPRAWADHHEVLWQHFAPVGPMQEQFVERIALCTWRLRRAARIETSVLQYQTLDQQATDARRLAASFERSAEPFELTEEAFTALTTSITNPAEHTAALARAADAETRRDDEGLAAAFINDASHQQALGKLSRYEAALERSLYRALHELERLQARRQGHGVSAPAVVDVDLSVSTEGT